MRIVIVEDEASIREGMEGLLGKLNPSWQTVGKAQDGSSGLKLIREEKPDAVIMDIRMPDMDGLTMLETLRREGVACRVIILSAYSDFAWAQRALELDVSSYLLKPVRLPELQKALTSLEEEIQREERHNMFLNLENMAKSALAGILEQSEDTDLLLERKYGIGRHENMAVFQVWLGGDYEKKRETVLRILNGTAGPMGGFRTVTAALPEWKQCALILYHMDGKGDWEAWFDRAVVPEVLSGTEGRAVCAWTGGEGLYALEECGKKGRTLLAWNLSLGNERLLSERRRKETVCHPLKYPPDLSVKIRKTVIEKNRKEFVVCFTEFWNYCVQAVHNPREIREACLTFLWTVLDAVQEYLAFHENELMVQEVLGRLMQAVTWEEIRGCMADSFRMAMDRELEGQQGKSPLVRRARRMMEEYYSQGITMEEVARKLAITPEYLSRQYKKETGASFTEEIRRLRVDKVKTLLVGTSLTLVRIAAMTGFSDAKYMSKVFREEVGVLPADYRRINS